MCLHTYYRKPNVLKIAHVFRCEIFARCHNTKMTNVCDLCVCVCVLTRLFHSLLEDDALVLMACRGALPSSSSSSTARTDLRGLAASFGGASPKSFLPCSSRMVWTSDRYL